MISPSAPSFDAGPILSYLSLPSDYTPSPAKEPLEFLRLHLPQLPPSHASAFSALLTPEQRAQLPLIRNRRLAYASQSPPPPQLRWSFAAQREPALWSLHGGPSVGLALPKPGEEEAAEEREWAKREFVGREGPEGEGMVGDLGKLLGGYEEERVGEELRRERRVRAARRADRERERVARVQEAAGGEGEEEGEDDELGSMSEHETDSEEEEASPEGVKRSFERAIRERFVRGELDWADYSCDWEDKWDAERERDGEEAWFDDEEATGQAEGTGVLDY